MIGTRQSTMAALLLAASLAAPPAVRGQEAPAAPDRPALELSLEETVKRALENNVDIAVERHRPQASAETVREAQAAYEPLLYSTILQRSQTDPARNVFAGAQEVNTDTTTYNFGLAQYLPTGADVQVNFNNNRSDTNSIFTTFNPSFGSTFNIDVTQPLLRNFSIDFSRQQIRVAKKNREISDVQFRQTVVNTVASVRHLYYDLIYAIDNLEAQRKSLALAQKLLDENQIKVRVGTMAPLDVVEAEAEVAGREETVIVAEAALAEAEDALKRAIFAQNDPEMWATRIVPSDRPTAEAIQVDTPAAIQRALENRTDIVAARKGLENADIVVKFNRNQALPAVNLVASYGSNGIGGTLIEREGLGGDIIRTVPGGYGDAISSVFGRDYPTWSLGVNISYPVFNRAGAAASARARVNRDQTLASLRRLEMQVTVEVRTAARAVETNFKRVESTRAARVFQERRLDAEEKRFAAGMSTNFFVTQAQRDLAVAEVAELRAIAEYRKSLVDFERVQEAGFSGGGSVGTVSTGSTGSSGSSGGTSAGGGTGANGGQ
jgi:outer membrane protein TolC